MVKLNKDFFKLINNKINSLFIQFSSNFENMNMKYYSERYNRFTVE